MLRKMLLVGCAVAILVSLPPGMAAAQDSNPNQRTYFTFSGSVELPGTTLPAGRYLFRLLDSPGNRHIVQVFDENEQQIHATILAIPAQRLDPADDPEVRFMETAADQPAAIRTWWYPGRTIGHEFIYPREQALRLAGLGEPVLTVATDATTAEAMREAELARIEASGATVEATEARDATGTAFPGQVVTERETAAVQPAPTQPAPAQPAPAETEPPTFETQRTALPRTATALPLLVLVGIGSLVGAVSLRRRRQK